MIYQVLRPATRLSCLLYFRKIFLLDVERVPHKGPLLIVCNHPSAFLEPCVLASTLSRPLYFLTRGDFFKGGMLSWFLHQTHQVPIYRAQDGFGHLRSNQGTFATCYKALSQGKAIIIFPETQTMLEKRLRPVQKGAARLALGALKQIEALHILPIGVTFSDPTKFASLVTVRCGEMLQVIPPTDTDDERVVIARLTAQIECALRSVMIHIEKPEREPLFDGLQMLVFHHTRTARFPVITADARFPAEEDRLAEYVNALSDDEAREMRLRIHDYEQALGRYGLTDRYFVHSHAWTAPWKYLLVPAVVLLALGRLVVALPSIMLHRFLDARVNRPPFYGALKWVMGFFAYATWFAILVVLGYVLFGLPGLLIAFTLVMTGHLVLQYFHDVGVRGFLAPLWMASQKKKQLLKQREAISRGGP